MKKKEKNWIRKITSRHHLEIISSNHPSGKDYYPKSWRVCSLLEESSFSNC